MGNMRSISSIILLITLVLAVASFDISEEILKATASGNFKAGVAKVNGTLPIGTPLAGYNHGARRVPYWPIPEFGVYTTFMTGAQGNLNPTWVKVLVIDNGQEQFLFITLDGIGADATLGRLAYTIAQGMGLQIPLNHVLFSASHSHSGPGAVSPDTLWALAPATEFPKLQRQLATSMAQAMIQAVQNMVPAKIAIGTGPLIGATVNRRAGFSPYVQRGTIDPHLGVIRVDTSDGKPLATVWNFAIHGVCYGPDNMYFSSDIMGGVCDQIEETIGGIALFMNADAGDVDPAPGICDGAPNFKGAPLIASAVKGIYDTLVPTDVGVIMNAFSQVIEFGPTDLNATLQRFDNCTTGGYLDICGFCDILQCDLNAHLYSSWIDQSPRFTAFGFVIQGVRTVIVSIPGEALVELGWWIRNDTLDMGFDITLLAGYSNAHMGYFATPDEYDIGGYESQLTLWGIDTAAKIRAGCATVAQAIAPGLFSPEKSVKPKFHIDLNL